MYGDVVDITPETEVKKYMPHLDTAVWEKITNHLLDQAEFGRKLAEKGVNIYLGEVADAVPELKKYINEDMDEEEANRWLMFLGSILLFSAEKMWKGEVDYVYSQEWARDEEDDQYDIYDGGFLRINFLKEDKN